MKTMVTLTHEEAQSYLAYALICETWIMAMRLLPQTFL